jgi:septum formation topological specificity factor MinE
VTRIEQAYFDYVKEHILPILKRYIGSEVTPETIKKMEDELITILKSHLIVHNWEVKCD